MESTSLAQTQALGGTSFSYVFPQNQLNFSNEVGNCAATRSVTAAGTFTGNISIAVAASNFGGGSDAWNLAGTDGIGKFVRNQGVAVTGTSSSGSPNIATAAGRSVGPQAQGIIMSIGARTTTGKSIAGTGVGFKQ